MNSPIDFAYVSDFILESCTARCKPSGPGFSSEYLSGVDSVAVIFSDSFRVIHYESLLPTVFPDKYYLEEHPRNLLNIDNFEWSYEDKSKHSRIITHQFTFTEEDYLDARE